MRLHSPYPPTARTSDPSPQWSAPRTGNRQQEETVIIGFNTNCMFSGLTYLGWSFAQIRLHFDLVLFYFLFYISTFIHSTASTVLAILSFGEIDFNDPFLDDSVPALLVATSASWILVMVMNPKHLELL